ncbi:hypothetical protein Tco_0811348 [Tanacetum coccineum]
MLDAFTSSMCSDPWGRMGFAMAMIEVSAENKLKKEVTMVVPNVDGEGHTKKIMPLEFEWKPPQCYECHVFGHSISSCRKRVVVNNAEKIVKNDDSFIVVTHKKNKGKKVTNNNDANNGFKLPKPKPKKEIGESSNTINNTSLQTNKEVNMDDSDSDIEEMIMEQRPKGASTPSNKTDQVLHTKVRHKETNKVIFCSFVYADNLQVRHRHLWEDLDLHKNMVRGQPWVLIGDFNAALNLKDIFSGSSVMNASMIEFKDCVANIEVVDINASGLYYTWNQELRRGKGILKKLDRCIGNMEFINEYDVVLQQWSMLAEGHSMYQLVTKLKALKKPFRKIMHDNRNLHDRVTKLHFEVEEIQKALDKNPADPILREEEAAYVHAFNEAKLDEERFLKQKAKVDWLEAGDANTTYFHKTIKSRNHRSRIEVIRDANGVEYTGLSVPKAFVNHYKDFLGTDMLCDDMDSTDLFLKQVSESSYNDMILREVNHTFIALIPKVSIPLRINDYRPISCCNVIYKCISKILTNRIISGIKDVVSDNQSAFIQGRKISYNILITQELMHNYHRKRGPPRCAFKVDIQKAYDTVNWKFLEHILYKFGFNPVMIKWIMACVTSSSFSIGLNGDIHGFFKGKRGLRQGDPLSPYRFTLVMEVLTLMLKKKVRLSNSFRYHHKCEALEIINVCFADDLFIFSCGDVNSATMIMESLDEFKRISGLVPSIPKSTVFFCNVGNTMKNEILGIMPFLEGNLPAMYLGVHLISSRLLNRDCNILVEKAKNRISDWKNKSLSIAGRLQLCKSILSSMQIYWALVLVIPKAKVAWDDICLPKIEGGLGLRSLEIRELIKPFIWVKIGNGKDTSLWHDLWDTQSPLSRYLSPRDITQEGYHLKNAVADLVSNNAWSWPNAWLLKAPNIGQIQAPNLIETKHDQIRWRDPNGLFHEFSVARAWVAVCPRGNVINWHKIVWFSHAVPRHSFHMWLVIRKALKTQDKLRMWDLGGVDPTNITYVLCGTQADSHTHLLLECLYASKVWISIRHLAGMKHISPIMDDIVAYLIPMVHKRNVLSVIGKLIVAAAENLITILKGGLKGEAMNSPGSIRIHIEQRIAAMMGYRGGRLEGDEEKLDDEYEGLWRLVSKDSKEVLVSSLEMKELSHQVLMPRVVKSRDEIFSRWGYCDNRGLSRLHNQSIERDHLIGIGFMLDFVEFIAFTFGDKEMILVIEAVSR